MNRFDIVEAYYVYLNLHHGGQWSPEYARLCRVLRYYRPSPCFSEARFLATDSPARDIYYALCEKNNVTA